MLLGGFHDHWWRADPDNPALLLAALNYYHYDFVTLMDGPQCNQPAREVAALLSDRIRIYPGYEEMFGWGHVVTVNPRAEKLESNEADPRKVLARLKATCDLVFLAHPAYPQTWETLFQTGEIDRLLNEGLIDGVELTIASHTSGSERNAELVRWYQARAAKGQRTPIVGGWDLHMAVPVPDLPPVLYTPHRPPNGHFEAPCDNRTILFAEENSLPCICAAIHAGETVIEEMSTGSLVGPPHLVQFLKAHGYHEAISRLDAQRDAVTLTISNQWVAGASGKFSISQAGSIRWPQTWQQTEALPISATEQAIIEPLPVLVERDVNYLPIVWHSNDGRERIWAVETSHPIQLEVFPWLGEGGPAVEIIPAVPFAGEIELEVEGSAPQQQAIKGRTLLPLRPTAPDVLPKAYHLRAQTANGLARSKAGFLTFVPVQSFPGDWSAIPKVGIDEARFVPAMAYGASRPWPGADEFSAQLQWAWDEEYFWLRAEVRDAIHFQPYRGHYVYNADCLQLALDPCLRRCDTIGHVYSFNLA
ncbi:MAG: hypothetical protein JOZ57_07390, partial [Abitibacteriaceae bacterium]|nr:hypothetical protein [Abditibacteriaceae bacterium]